ncbi:MAG: nicotinamide-nucleotide amidohydrolase family protein [Coriobacteriales bacterium]|nr:nicotinamide-nucleotide amidohydrolase family protein [Coriobacteriales bacterium]
MTSRSAAIVTVGSELTEGLRTDTNTREIAHALAARGARVLEAVSVPDDAEILAESLRRLTSIYDVVIVTGGLGPTHDDITRVAAADALGLALRRDERLVALLEPMIGRHRDPEASAQVLEQALVLDGADVIDATSGTAPGLVVPTARGMLVLLPGPPHEMRPMLSEALERLTGARETARELGIVGMTESDVQVRVQRATQNIEGVGFTVLARPGEVRAVFVDEGGGPKALDEAAGAAGFSLGDACYATDGSTLAEVIVREATARGLTLSLAESCTGGLVAAALTDVPGSSAVFLGGVVSYSDEAKVSLLDVDPPTIEKRGAVSAETVEQMATGAQEAFGADIAVAVSGIAGPGGGSDEKPVGTVWFGVVTSRPVPTGARFPTTPHVDFVRHFAGDRDGVRTRATAIALDSLRRAVLGLPIAPAQGG